MLLFSRILIFTALVFTACKSDADGSAQLNLETQDTLKNTEILMGFIMGKFDPSVHEDFVIIEVKYADKEGLYLQKEAYEAFIKMHTAAEKEGIPLVIRSATRNFDYQKGIWERKWRGETKLEGGINAVVEFQDPVLRARKILEYSSMPGSSRHHWGTDIDLNDFKNEWFELEEGLRMYQWMEKHAATFGFCQPYSKKDADRPTGYNEEKWHWSYIPLAKAYSDAASKGLQNRMLVGFEGSQTAETIDIVKNFVLGINKACL